CLCFAGMSPLHQAVAAGRVLQLLPGRPQLGWVKVQWKAQLDVGYWQRILTAEKNSVASPPKGGRLSGRAAFQQETLSLRISPVSAADSGIYMAEFEDASGSITALCFQVSVWGEYSIPTEPIGQLLLEARILHWEQGWCNLSLLCTVPSTGSVSYSWSCSGDALGALGHQPRLHLQLRGDANSTVCRCNASNAVSWDTASTDMVLRNCLRLCSAFPPPGLFRIIPWGIVAMSLGLALTISVALIVTCYWWRKRRKDPPGGLSLGLVRQLVGWAAVGLAVQPLPSVMLLMALGCFPLLGLVRGKPLGTVTPLPGAAQGTKSLLTPADAGWSWLMS
uniref:Natural killer cell receptor 2B4 immunoglobulin domain-containing protein n=1 Tax=Falco tinnunculus TaxID=100819 RepID=A0A8C4UZF1_FALTI